MVKFKLGRVVLYLFLLLAGGFLIASSLAGETVVSGEDSTLLQKSVIVYYFHGNVRCPSCRKIEQYTKEAVEQYFNDELKSSKLIFKLINIEEKENKHFVKDYQLYTKSVVLSLVTDGKEVKYSNLTNIWNYLRNKQKFYDYIKDEVTEYLADVK